MLTASCLRLLIAGVKADNVGCASCDRVVGSGERAALKNRLCNCVSCWL